MCDSGKPSGGADCGRAAYHQNTVGKIGFGAGRLQNFWRDRLTEKHRVVLHLTSAEFARGGDLSWEQIGTGCSVFTLDTSQEFS